MVGAGGWRTGLGVGLTLALAGGAVAQTPPPSTEPGTIQRRLEPQPLPRAAPPPVAVPESEPPAPPPGAEEIRFELRGVRLSGNTVFGAAELADVWQPALGREVALNELWRIAAAITVRYRNAGYVLSRALVPAQEIEGGIAEIRIVEGYIEDVIVEGEPTGTRAFLDHAIERIKASRPLEARVLERYMLLLNDLAGVTAQSILRPSPIEPGASELVIDWQEKKYGGSLSLDNFGTRYLGPLELTGTVVANDLYGRYDSTELRGLVTAQVEELRYVSLRHTLPLTGEGTALLLDGSYSWTEPQQLGALQGLDTDGHAAFGALLLTHPLIRTRSQNLSLYGGFRALDSENDLFGDTLSRDRTRVLTAALSFDTVDAWRGITLIGFDIAQGLDILGARGDGDGDPPTSRAEGKADFTRLAASVAREQDLGRGFSLRLALSGQYSFDPLVASEQYGVGGEVFGRGYGPYEIAGDQGLAGTVQLQYGGRYPFARLGELIESYQLYGFYDFGSVWRKDEPGSDHDGLSSAGLGLDLNLARNVAATTVLAMPLTRDPTTRSDPNERYPRLFFRLTKRF